MKKFLIAAATVALLFVPTVARADEPTPEPVPVVTITAEPTPVASPIPDAEPTPVVTQEPTQPADPAHTDYLKVDENCDALGTFTVMVRWTKDYNDEWQSYEDLATQTFTFWPDLPGWTDEDEAKKCPQNFGPYDGFWEPGDGSDDPEDEVSEDVAQRIPERKETDDDIDLACLIDNPRCEA